MSGVPPTSPTPGPDADDERGLQESFKVIRAKRLPTAFGQNGTTLFSETPPIGTGQDLRGMESCEGPNDTTEAKIKAPGMEIHKSFMWRSYVQYYAICHGGAPPIPSLTSNASYRDHSPLHLKAGLQKYVPGTAAPPHQRIA